MIHTHITTQTEIIKVISLLNYKETMLARRYLFSTLESSSLRAKLEIPNDWASIIDSSMVE